MVIAIQNEGNIAQAKCPMQHCHAPFTETDLPTIFGDDRALEEKYRDLQIRQMFEKRLKKCPRCPNAVEVADGIINIKCPECRFTYCSGCLLEPHAGQTCDDARSAAPNPFVATNECKPCPTPNCDAKIQKNGGCNYVQCPKCPRQEFCWFCGTICPYGAHTPHDAQMSKKYIQYFMAIMNHSQMYAAINGNPHSKPSCRSMIAAAHQAP